MSPPLLVFDTLVGANDSLKSEYSAGQGLLFLYPPRGLHTIIFLGKQEQGNLFLLNVCTVLPLIQKP